MGKFEYKIEHILPQNSDILIVGIFNHLGKKRWELVGLFQNHLDTIAVFKRKKRWWD